MYIVQGWREENINRKQKKSFSIICFNKKTRGLAENGYFDTRKKGRIFLRPRRERPAKSSDYQQQYCHLTSIAESLLHSMESKSHTIEFKFTPPSNRHIYVCIMYATYRDGRVCSNTCFYAERVAFAICKSNTILQESKKNTIIH